MGNRETAFTGQQTLTTMLCLDPQEAQLPAELYKQILSGNRRSTGGCQCATGALQLETGQDVLWSTHAGSRQTLVRWPLRQIPVFSLPICLAGHLQLIMADCLFM
jgi:hypothetical protein